MPLYEYQCEACGVRFELIRKFSDPPLETCASCGKGPVTKLVSSPAFQFKGSGWYITDYAKKPGGSASEGESSPTSASTKDNGKAKDSPDSKEKGSSGDTSAKTSTPAPAATTPAKDS